MHSAKKMPSKEMLGGRISSKRSASLITRTTTINSSKKISRVRMAQATPTKTKTITSRHRAVLMKLDQADNQVWSETLSVEVPVMLTPWINVSASMTFKFKIRCLVIVRNLTCQRLPQCPNFTHQPVNITYRTCHLSRASDRDRSPIPSSLTMGERPTRCQTCSTNKTTTEISTSRIKTLTMAWTTSLITSTIWTPSTTDRLAVIRTTRLVVMKSGMNQGAELSKKISITCSNSLTTMTLSTKVVRQFKMEHTKDKRTVSTAKASKTLKKVMMGRVVKVKERMKKASRSTWSMVWSCAWSKLKEKRTSTWWTHRGEFTICRPTLLERRIRRGSKKWEPTVRMNRVRTINEWI